MDILRAYSIWSQIINTILTVSIILELKVQIKNSYSPTKSSSVRNRKQTITTLINSMKSKLIHNIVPTETLL